MDCRHKIVVFDLDETLGYFTEFGMFWDAVNSYIKHIELNIPEDQNLFDSLLHLYPEFLRPNILNILNYLKKKKQKNHCHKLMIYTNNQGPKEWAHYIIKYFEKKLNYKLFDQIIAAFKIHSEYVELCRTTHLKTHKDLIKCTKVPDNTQICFLDDVFYPGMKHDNVYYINIKPYIHDLTFNEMIDRFINSSNFINDPISCKTYILNFMKSYDYVYVKKQNDLQKIDVMLSKKILSHLHVFFNIKQPKSTDTKRKKIFKNRTLKINYNL
jgi:hypothetical protein